MHADRTNRVVLAIVSLIALALGGAGLLAAYGAFGHDFQHRRLLDNQFSDFFGRNGRWLWPAIAGGAFIISLLVLIWLLRLLFSTDRTGDIAVASTKSDGTSSAAGRTTLQSSALTQAVGEEIESYHGVMSAKARILGKPSTPTLAIDVSASRRADLPGLIERIQRDSVAHARTALEQPSLPVKLNVTVTDKGVSRAA